MYKIGAHFCQDSWRLAVVNELISNVKLGCSVRWYTMNSISKIEFNTNAAESFFSRMRRGEIGHHHHVAGSYLIRVAQEAAWRENYRRAPNGTQVDRIVALAMHNNPSVDFCGYWQRGRVAA
jgi:hypothetical protein